MSTNETPKFNEARDDILCFLQYVWETNKDGTKITDPYQLVYENVEPAKDPRAEASKLWGEVRVRHYTGNRTTISRDGVWENRCGLAISVYVPLGQGLDEFYKIGQPLIDAFRSGKYGTEILNRDICVENPRLREVGPDGNFFVCQIMLDFQYDQIT